MRSFGLVVLVAMKGSLKGSLKVTQLTLSGLIGCRDSDATTLDFLEVYSQVILNVIHL